MNASDIRKEMANLGWQSTDRMTKEGWGDKVGYSIWFERWDWHEHKLLGNKACYHSHGYVFDGVDRIVHRASEIAKRAWTMDSEFPPDQLIHGELQEGLMKDTVLQLRHKQIS